MATLLLKSIIIAIAAKSATCTITGISYLDPLNFERLPDPGSNPCNPLYWYPRQLPEHCYTTTTEAPAGTPPPPVIPLPVPVPLPLPLPVPAPFPPMVPPMMPPLPGPFPPPPLPFGVSIAPPGPILPMAGPPFHPPPPYPYPPYQTQRQVGIVPGLPGIVSPDGGINLLPFSDAYSDMLEKHKNKLIRKRMREVLSDYDDFPRMRRYKKHRKYIRVNYD